MDPAQSDTEQSQTQPRPYRSKRHRPCDVCRRRKHACFLEDRPPCRVCRSLGTACTFNEPPTRRRKPPRPASSPSYSSPGQQLLAGDAEGETIYTGPYESTDVPTSASVCDGGTTANSQEEPPRVSQFTFGEGILDPLQHPLSLPHNHNFWYGNSWFAANAALSPMPFPTCSTDVNRPGGSFSAYAEATATAVQVLSEAPQTGVAWPARPPRPRSPPPDEQMPRPVTSLDTPEVPSAAQCLVLSGEMDPYLFRHLRFEEDGSLDFGRFQCRLLAQETSRNSQALEASSLPVQFLTTPNRKSTPTSDWIHQSREALDKLIPPGVGARLVGLFLRYVFPDLPILSRSPLGMRNQTLIPSSNSLDVIPAYLLAAIYAVVEPYRRYDAVLCISEVDETFPESTLWKMAFDGMSRKMNEAPDLSVIQTMLICQQKPVDKMVAILSDNPSSWFLVNSLVHLTFRLGLHLDCKTWPIPEADKRLRRRVWWVVYSETVWRSLLLGAPRTIHSEDWEVEPLSEDDFIIEHLCCPTEETAHREPSRQTPCPFCHSGFNFRYLSTLSTIAYDVYETFYALTSTKTLARDFIASSAAAQPLLDRIDRWKLSLPRHILAEGGKGGYDTGRSDYFHSRSAAHLNLTFLTLEALIYRAVVRPLAPGVSGEVDRASDRRDVRMGDHSQQPTTDMRVAGDDDGETAAVSAAMGLVKRSLKFVEKLNSFDHNSFLYPWTQACFTTISNFIILLLVQAPAADGARELLALLARWTSTLRDQCVTFSHMRTALLQLDTIFWIGLEKAFQFPLPVKEAFRSDFPTWSAYNQSRLAT